MFTTAEFLDRYGRELLRRGVPTAAVDRILAEASSHLAEAARQLQLSGCSELDAEKIALRRFGSPEELAAAWNPEELRPSTSLAVWILSTTAGVTGGFVLVLSLGKTVAPLLAMMLILPAAGLVIGGAMGLGQSLSLRHAGLGWITRTAAGVSIGLTAFSVLIESMGLTKGYLPHDLAALAIVGFGTGTAVGLLQERTSRLWWFLVAVGMSIGCVLGGSLATLVTVGIRSPMGFLVLAACVGFVVSTFTAPSLGSARAARLS